MRFTQCCACHEIFTSAFTKCCACHDICTSRFTKSSALHEICTSRPTKRRTCQEICVRAVPETKSAMKNDRQVRSPNMCTAPQRERTSFVRRTVEMQWTPAQSETFVRAGAAEARPRYMLKTPGFTLTVRTQGVPTRNVQNGFTFLPSQGVTILGQDHRQPNKKRIRSDTDIGFRHVHGVHICPYNISVELIGSIKSPLSRTERIRESTGPPDQLGDSVGSQTWSSDLWFKDSGFECQTRCQKKVWQLATACERPVSVEEPLTFAAFEA